MNKKTRIDFKHLENMYYEDAQLIIERPYFLTPITYNGIKYMDTLDINENRVNVIVEKDIITSVQSVG